MFWFYELSHPEHYCSIAPLWVAGVNSGTIFMNLTRMRLLKFDRLALEAYEKYKGTGFRYLDQDILNIVFGTHKG